MRALRNIDFKLSNGLVNPSELCYETRALSDMLAMLMNEDDSVNISSTKSEDQNGYIVLKILTSIAGASHLGLETLLQIDAGKNIYIYIY